jgi:hypothetical protein
MNNEPFYWDRGKAFGLLRLIGSFQLWLVYDSISFVGDRITDHEPCIIAPTHTGRFNDIMLSLAAAQSPARKDHYLSVAWAGFVKSKALLYQFHMLPLENQFGNGGNSGNRLSALQQLNKIKDYLLGERPSDSQALEQDEFYEAKAVLLFPSGKCGTGRFEEPWKPGIARIIGQVLLESQRDLVVYLVPITYGTYLNHLHSDVEVNARVIRFDETWRSRFASTEKRARQDAMDYLDHELQQVSVLHRLDLPTLKELEEFQDSGVDLHGKVAELIRLASSSEWTDFLAATAEKQDPAQAQLAHEALTRQVKARITRHEDMLLATCFCEEHRTLLERVRQASDYMESHAWRLPNDLAEKLDEYEGILRSLDIPYGKEQTQIDWKLILLAPLALMGLGIYIPMWILRNTIATPVRRLFHKPPHMLQFRGEDAVWQMLTGWGLFYAVVFGISFGETLELLHGLPWYAEAATGIAFGLLSVVVSLSSAIAAFKFGWRFRLLAFRWLGNPQLQRADTLRAQIQTKVTTS